MINMVDKNLILLKYFRDRESKSSISRSLHLSRKTVRKYISVHEQASLSPNFLTELEKGLSGRPAYDVASRGKVKLTQEIESDINICLGNNAKKLNSGLHKQVMKKIDIHEYLLSKGHDIGYSSVCNYIRAKSSNGKECFIKQLYSPGVVCEFDWGDVKLFINGKLQVFNMAVFTSASSNYRWAKLFYRQDTLAFGQGHIDFFSHLGGVHKELVYDNMRVAIRKFVGRTIKEPTDSLLELSNYYKFKFRFCNIRKGNEKGHVEKSVEYIRRKSFCLKDHFTSVDEANTHLLSACGKLNNTAQQLSGGKTANQLFEAEKPHLYESRVAYKCFDNEHVKVDKYSTITFSGNRYSVPDFLVGKLLDIRIFAERIDGYYNGEPVCTHTRSYGAHKWVLDINHYLTTLSMKPGALSGSVAFSQLGCQVKNIYQTYFIYQSKDFIELLQYCKDHGIDFDVIERAIDKVRQITPSNITKDKILAMMDKEKEPVLVEKKDNEIYHSSRTMLTELAALLN